MLVDLDGWIGDEPPRRVAALSPAPVRGHWLGWAGTTADDSLHYMVSDNVVTLADRQHAMLYSERFVLLPRSYQLNDHAQLYYQVLSRRGGRRGRAAAAEEEEAAEEEAAEDEAEAAEAVEAADAATRRRRGGGGGGRETATSQQRLAVSAASEQHPAKAGGEDAAMEDEEVESGRQARHAGPNQMMKLSPDVFEWAGAAAHARALMLLDGVTSVHVQYPSAGATCARRCRVGVRRSVTSRPCAQEASPSDARRAVRLAVDTLVQLAHHGIGRTGASARHAARPQLCLAASSLTVSAGLPHGHVESLKAYEDLIHLLARPSYDAVSGHDPSAPRGPGLSQALGLGSAPRPSSQPAAVGTPHGSPAGVHARQLVEEQASGGGIATITKRHRRAARTGHKPGQQQERPWWTLSALELTKRGVFGTSALLTDSSRLLPHLTGPRPWGTFMKFRSRRCAESDGGPRPGSPRFAEA